ncbi:protein translocase subunit SecF [Elioraea rosea]|uniref:protein translocase subunit SecF n=1 Tax=Elioraea rosea TaxID=2492390 RepID=UPI001182380A|nr:protein translocase subunit SecF [Elioraea rosea]
MRLLRLVPDNTRIPFMKGRIVGVVFSALLSLVSVVLFVTPGLNYGIDFEGGIVIEARTPGPADFPQLRSVVSALEVGEVRLQQFGAPEDVLIRLPRQPGGDQAQQQAVERVRGAVTSSVPGAEIRRVEAVGATVSDELFRDGMIALGLSMVAMLLYIWFRFEWQFGVGAIVTLTLDVTKLIGFYALTQMTFNLTSVAAILTMMGFSINDKVVVYDRMRENLRKYKTMPLRELIDLSINETLARTIGTSVAVFLAALPLVLFGGEALREFSIVTLVGIVIGTASSIFIAAPILLFLGENRLRRGTQEEAKAPA